MKLETILSKFLPSSISPKSIQDFANTIETFGKIVAGMLAIFYVTGLIILGLYHSGLHVRSIELLQVRYLFVGFYYFAFLFLHIAYPVWWIKSIPLKLIFVFMFLAFVIFLNPIHSTYFGYLADKSALRTSYYEFQPLHITILNGNLSALSIGFISTPLAMFLFVTLSKSSNAKIFSPILIAIVLFVLSFNYQIFTKNIFPFIPDGIGGGKSPIVHIVFADSVPYDVTSNFDLVGQVSGFVGNYYYGQLVYVDNESVFLKEPFWFADTVYEIQRKDIIMLEYAEYNPAEIGQPGLYP